MLKKIKKQNLLDLKINFFNLFINYINLNKNLFKYVIINNERYNYTLVEYICSQVKGEKFSILDFCTLLNITIPHFCYHPDLSIAGNCRMCLVQLDGSIKPIASCAISISHKMIINTQSIFVKKMQESILEFLLFNHPLDCPICDQGGECDLQDLTISYGNDRGRLFSSNDVKRSVNDNLCNNFIKFVLTRCIHCTRCIRFLSEFGGNFNLGMLGRGNQSEIGLYINNVLNSEFSSNIIELCPVGALTSKIYSFKYRSWDSQYYESIDISNSFSSPIRVYVKSNKINRILSQFDEYLNWNVLTEKSRYFYDGLYTQRLMNPTIKIFYIKNFYRRFEFINVSWVYIKKIILNNFFYIFNKKKLNLNIKPILGDFIDLELIFFYKLLNVNNAQTTIFNATDELLINSFKDSCINLDFRLNYIYKSLNLNNFNLCILLNLNLRLENPLLNAKIRQDYLWNNLLIYAFGSFYNLTYKYITISNQIKDFIKFVEGRLFLSNIFIKEKIKPIVIYSSNLLQRHDNSSFLKLFQTIKRLNQ